MSMNDETETVANGLVVTMEYSLTVDGEVIDSSDDGGPIQFIQGEGNIVPGLESALYGMAIGQNKMVVVPPGEGYGEEDPEAVADIPRDEFPSQIPLEPGIELQLRNHDGEVLDAFIESVNEETVQLNFNHPLAGKDLHFDVKIVGLRQATAEELDHGHVHEEGLTHED
jgi:FKBP-type peptidyl-prolyl cis-trans isomerase SlyD